MAASILAATSAVAQPNEGPVFVVFLEIHFDAKGKPSTLSVSQVVNPAVDPKKPVAVAIPDSFLAGVKDKLAQGPPSPDGKPAFTYVFFDSTQPSILDLDPVTRVSSGQGIFLRPETSLDIRRETDGWVADGDPQPAGGPLSIPERLALDAIDGKPARTVAPSGEAIAPTAGKLRFTFRHVAGRRDTLLTVANGYDRWLIYSAFISPAADTEPKRTSTCVVAAGKSGIEHWPFRIERMKVSSFRLGTGPMPTPSCR